MHPVQSCGRRHGSRFATGAAVPGICLAGEAPEPTRYDRGDASRLRQRSPTDDDKAIIDLLAEQKRWLEDENVPVLTQMLCVETPTVRIHLTEMLASIKGERASIRPRPAGPVRRLPAGGAAAVKALQDRPGKEFRQALLDGFRHPWPPVARPRGRATALGDKEAVQPLKEMLKLLRPIGPGAGRGERLGPGGRTSSR